jgi:hypothetical protein
MFKTDLHSWDIKPIAGKDLWINQVPLHYYSAIAKRQITVPAGYISDLASIPKIVHSFMYPAAHEIRAAAEVHDYIYTDLCDQLTKKQADLILFEAMGNVINPAPKWKRYVVYMAVRVGGKGNWF